MQVQYNESLVHMFILCEKVKTLDPGGRDDE